MKKDDIIEKFLLVIVIVSIVMVPFAIHQVDRFYRSSSFPEGSQIITLYGIAEGGVWTREPVNSFNYWWKKFKRVKEIPVNDDGTPIFFRATSSDVMHSFAIPLYRIGPYDVKPGEFVTVELKTERQLKSTRFLCYQYCDKDHKDMYGRLVVLPQDEE